MQELASAFELEILKRYTNSLLVLGTIQEYVVITTGFETNKLAKYLLIIQKLNSKEVFKLRDYDIEVPDNCRGALCLSSLDLNPNIIFEDIQTIDGVYTDSKELQQSIACFIDVLLEENQHVRAQNYSPNLELLDDNLFY